jgi:D-alanine-D-alanine ligase
MDWLSTLKGSLNSELMIEAQLRTDIPVLMFYNLDFFEWTEKDRKDVLELVEVFSDALKAMGHPVFPLQLSDVNIVQLFEKYNPKDYVVFNWCEGIPGIPHSFGKAARALEELGYSFTGSPSAILDLNDDKRRIKTILCKNHLQTPRWMEFGQTNLNKWDLYPAIVKPAFEHCSVGISPDSIVDDGNELKKRAEYVTNQFKQPIIIEEFIDGREFQVGVWGNDPVESLPPVESDFSQLNDQRDHICTMDSKDDPNSYRYQKWNMIVPAPLNKIENEILAELCINAYKAIGVRDYARMDVRYKDDNFFILDINTNPYIGPECGLIQAAKIAGYSYGEFGSRLINLAWQRKEKANHPSDSR